MLATPTSSPPSVRSTLGYVVRRASAGAAVPSPCLSDFSFGASVTEPSSPGPVGMRPRGQRHE
jgi:hypothetical protein